LPDDLVYPNYFECPVLPLAVFRKKVEQLFLDINLTAEQKKEKLNFYIFYSVRSSINRPIL
jgi:hypothetical protein